MLNKILNKLAEIPTKIELRKYQVFPKDTTSLILVNCQKGLVDEQPQLQSKLQELITFARQNNWSVIHSPFNYSERKYPSPAHLLIDKKLKSAHSNVDLLFVEPNDIILPYRTTLSAFSETNLEQTLTNNGIEHIVLAGPLADLTLDSTMRDGVQFDFHTAVITDVLSMTTNEYSIKDYTSTLSKYAQTVTNLKKLKKLASKSST